MYSLTKGKLKPFQTIADRDSFPNPDSLIGYGEIRVENATDDPDNVINITLTLP